MSPWRIRSCEIVAQCSIIAPRGLGAYGKRLRKAGIILIEQLLTLEDEPESERAHTSNATTTHPIEHICDACNSPDLFDERVAEDLVPLGVTVEILETGQLVNERRSENVRVSPTPSPTGAGTGMLGRNDLAFLPNHLWKGEAGTDKINNGPDAITPDNSLTVSGEGGPLFLVTKPRTFPPP